MCIEKMKLHFILPDYSGIRETNQAKFESFSKLLTF